MKSIKQDREFYPQCNDMESAQQANLFLPESLRMFLKSLFVGTGTSVKIASIGQAMLQATRPRAILAPLQLGLGVQLLHHFASRFLVDTLHKHGFACSYNEVTMFERSAAVSSGVEIPNFTPENFVQYVADNVDHNIRTLDGHNTFHGMGIIATVTPGTFGTMPVPRRSVSAEEIASAGRIEIKQFSPVCDGLQSLRYGMLQDHREEDVTANVDLLWNIALPLRSCRPLWSGMMQLVHKGEHPGKSSIEFLPMIDLNPSDMTCIYSTLLFVSSHARCYNVTPILTFDQPLWWKAVLIQMSVPTNSEIKNIVLRLGGFHTEMSFLGAIGHLMADSGLRELMECIYASNTVVHILSGKAVSRAIRAHLLVTGVLNALLMTHVFSIPPLQASRDQRDNEPAERSADVTTASKDRTSYMEPLQATGEDANLSLAAETIQVSDQNYTITQKVGEGTSEADFVLQSAEGFPTDADDQASPHTARQAVDESESSGGTTSTSAILLAAGKLYDDLIAESITIDNLRNSQVLQDIHRALKATKDELQKNRTAKLWLQYMEMVNILQVFIKAERTGNWALHLKAIRQMLPFLAASGHSNYTKSLHIYLSRMETLQNQHPDVYQHFVDGFHVGRRSDRYWAGLSEDLLIEQVLMRSLKTTGGLTRGRGMTETQRLVWLLSSKACSEVNLAMQNLTSVNFVTSEQHDEMAEVKLDKNDKHKDLSKARQKKDMADTSDLLNFLTPRDPFQKNPALYDIVTGMTADDTVNVDTAREVGEKILDSMNGKRVAEYTFRKKDQAITLSDSSAVKTTEGDVQIDPQLLFQRLVTLGNRQENLSEAFQFELCSFPPALFESKYMPRQQGKSQLADELWSGMPKGMSLPLGEVQYVLDGGALLHRVVWNRGLTYDEICKQYVSYVKKHYGKPTVVFDGYLSGASTKDVTQQRRAGLRVGVPVQVSGSMVFNGKKQDFLANKENKQQFITLLDGHLRRYGCRTEHASADADLLIVQTAISTTEIGNKPTVLVADDTDILILLCYHWESAERRLFLKPEPRYGTKKQPRCWDISVVKSTLGSGVCNNILFVHAFLGCDTTSYVHGFGKSTALKLIRNNKDFEDQAKIFANPNSAKVDVIKAGERALVCLYKGKLDDNLDFLRLQRYQQKISRRTTFVKPEVLPPTSGAAKYHSMRVYLQVQQWMGNPSQLQPTEWGWYDKGGRYFPVLTDKEAAPPNLLKIIRCNCKTGCSSRQCTCRANGLECTNACGVCRGVCTNVSPIHGEAERDTDF